MDIKTFLFTLLFFWVLLYLLGRFFHLERYRLEIQPAYLVYKSESLSKVLSSLSTKGSVLWKVFFNMGLIFAAVQLIYVTYTLVNNILKFISPSGVGVPFSLVIPGITIRLYWLPYFFVAAMIIAVTHEVAHGVAAQLEKVPLESAGIFVALVFPSAFVMFDKERFEKALTLSKLRIISAGSAINLATGLIVFLLLSALFTSSSGILILETTKEGPLEKVGLSRWDTIYAINGTDISSSEDLHLYMHNVTIGEALTLDTNKGNVSIKTKEGSGGQAIIGLSRYSFYYPCRFSIGYTMALSLFMILDWTYLLVFGIAILNMLPLYPFDGDKFLYYVLEKVAKGRGREVRVLYNALSLVLIAGNIIMSFLRYGVLSF